MKTPSDPVGQVLRKLYGKPCWNVQQGYGSFLTFEFGNPHLEVREPIPLRRAVSPRVRKALSRRQVYVHGDWHLWIYCCNWTVFQDGKRLASNSSKSRKIEFAARQLQGQALTQVTIDADEGKTIFEFDYRGRLETRRWDLTSEQWILHDPSKFVLQIRGDGQYSYDRETMRCTDTEWKRRPANWKLL